MEESKNQQYRFARLLVLRSIAYILTTSILAYFGESLIPDDGIGVSLSLLYGVLVGLSVLQFAFLFVSSEERNLLILTLADVSVATFLIKSTGASTSPFVVLLPLLSLASSVLFSRRAYLMIALGSILALIPIAIGFRASVAGTALVTLGTAIVGYSLKLALSKSETQKSRLESLQRAIMANIPSGLLSVDSRGKIIQLNKVACKILDVKEQELLGHFLQEIFPELDKRRSELETRTSISDVLEPVSNRKTINHKLLDGRELKLGYSLSRLSLPESGEIIGTLILFQDLTEAIFLEEHLKLSEKLAAVGKLAAGIAHEIRNPLAGISGAAQLLEADNLSDENRRLLAIIQRESARLDSLIGEFLEYVRPAPPKKEAIRLHKIAGQVVESLMVNSKWKSMNCQLHLTAESAEKAALGDENKVSQVLLNLVLNAGQAGARDVWIETSDDLKVRVLDNGPGIPADIQARIFEPFFTTKDKGTGLGLAIAFKTLEGVGATIQVKSPLADLFPAGGGTVFEIQFKQAGSHTKEAA